MAWPHSSDESGSMNDPRRDISRRTLPRVYATIKTAATKHRRKSFLAVIFCIIFVIIAGSYIFRHAITSDCVAFWLNALSGAWDREAPHTNAFQQAFAGVVVFLLNTGLLISILVTIWYRLNQRTEALMKLTDAFGVKERDIRQALYKELDGVADDTVVDEKIDRAFALAEEKWHKSLSIILGSERDAEHVIERVKSTTFNLDNE